MRNNLNTLLVTLYVHLDDTALPRLGVSRDHRPGRKPLLTDAELLCLLVAQQLLQFSSERRFIRYASTHLVDLFPHLPQQSGYSKRVRAAGPLVSQVITELARDTNCWEEITRLVDATPIPCAASKETVKRSDLAGAAGYGYCASHSRFFWGFKLYLLCTPAGMPIIWGLANPKIGEREALTEILAGSRHLVAPGQVIIGDKGFAGTEFERLITEEFGAHLVRPDRRNEKPWFGSLGKIRQWVESVFDTLKGQLNLEEHGARTLRGLYARIGARLLALATGIWHNWQTATANKRSLIAYDH